MLQAVLTTSSNLLDKKHSESWMDLPQAEQADTAYKLADAVETSSFQVIRNIQQPTIIINITVNISMYPSQLATQYITSLTTSVHILVNCVVTTYSSSIDFISTYPSQLATYYISISWSTICITLLTTPVHTLVN